MAAPLLLGLATFLLHLPFAGQYGFFRDELYFIACGQHLDWGYVDQPPLIALVTRAAVALTGTSLFGFRLWSALAAGLLVLCVAALARALGGGRAAQLLAAIATFFAPILLVDGHLVTMNAFEPVLWTAAALALARLLQTSDARRWLLVGLAVGVGLMNKHSMAFLAVGLGAGVLISRARRVAASPWLAAGIALAGVIVLPHVLWQVAHGWPMLELLENGRARKNAPFALGGFLAGQLLGLGPLYVLVWAAGLVHYLRDPTLRALGVAWLVVLGLLVALKGKDYYAAPAYPMLFAAGGVAWERVLRKRWQRAAAGVALVAAGAATAWIVVPILPPATLLAALRAIGFKPPGGEQMAYRELPQHIADQFGWPALARTVSRAYLALPEDERRDAVVVARNYGEAGALDFHARELPLPRVISGHNSYWLWGPGPVARPRAILVVNQRVADVAKSCAEATQVATTPPDPFVLPYEDEVPIVLCRGLKLDLPALWPRLKLFI